MLGEIIHYNEERAYGFIEVENDTNQYFFHISNLIDKNIKNRILTQLWSLFFQMMLARNK